MTDVVPVCDAGNHPALFQPLSLSGRFRKAATGGGIRRFGTRFGRCEKPRDDKEDGIDNGARRRSFLRQNQTDDQYNDGNHTASEDSFGDIDYDGSDHGIEIFSVREADGRLSCACVEPSGLPDFQG